MTREEFLKDIGPYAGGLWPKFHLTEEQNELWFHSLRFTDVHTTRQALANAYARTKWKEPALADVLAAVKELKRAHTSGDPDFDADHIAQVQREQAEDVIALQDWTAEDYENGKREIIAHEPGLAVFEGAPANGVMWRHFLVERYLYERVATFPGSARVIHRPGEKDVIIPPPVVYVSRAMAWANGPQPRRVGFQSVSGGARERHAAQNAKVALNEAVTV